jgi:DNA-directed RNA polymerase subunit RPC12/RpoP
VKRFTRPARYCPLPQGREDRSQLEASRECVNRFELDLETLLLWTRVRSFPLSRLESRLKCPRCGSRHIVMMFTRQQVRCVPSECLTGSKLIANVFKRLGFGE